MCVSGRVWPNRQQKWMNYRIECTGRHMNRELVGHLHQMVALVDDLGQVLELKWRIRFLFRLIPTNCLAFDEYLRSVNGLLALLLFFIWESVFTATRPFIEANWVCCNNWLCNCNCSWSCSRNWCSLVKFNCGIVPLSVIPDWALCPFTTHSSSSSSTWRSSHIGSKILHKSL